VFAQSFIAWLVRSWFSSTRHRAIA